MDVIQSFVRRRQKWYFSHEKTLCYKTKMNDRVTFCPSNLLVFGSNFAFFFRGCLGRLIFHIIIVGSAARLNVEFLCESPIHSSLSEVSKLIVNHLLEYTLYCCSQHAQARVFAGYSMTQVRTDLKWALAVGRQIYLWYLLNEKYAVIILYREK